MLYECSCIHSVSPVFRSRADRPVNVNVTEGDDITITCNATAEPTASVQWLKNGAVLNRKSSKVYKLHLVLPYIRLFCGDVMFKDYIDLDNLSVVSVPIRFE
jgi:Immunoglobulin domain